MIFKYIFKKLDIGKAIIVVATFVVISMTLLMVAIPLVFGFDDDEIWQINKGDIAKVSYVGSPEGYVNLGEVSFEYQDSGYTGEIYDGYNDPTQKAMAKELLELYGRAARKQQSLLDTGISEQDIIETILGTHAGEVDTYSWKEYRKLNSEDNDSDKPLKTYIPLTYVKWSDYGRVRTQAGRTMNFSNYNWEDFKSRHDIENPTNGLLGNKGSGNDAFVSGFNYSTLRSPTGAIGPLQMQPQTWKNDSNYLHGWEDYTASPPVQIMDIEGYTKSNVSGRNEDLDDKGFGDIFSLGDLALANVNWQEEFYSVSEDSPTKTTFGVDRNNSDLIRIYFHYRYYGGQPSVINNNREMFWRDMESIVNDNALAREFHENYQNRYGHGNDQELIYKAYTDRGWTKGDNGSVTKTEDGKTITISRIQAIHPLRAYFKGKSWYRFLSGIAYGGSPQNENTNRQLNKVVYNYMTDEDNKRKTSQTVRADALDNRMAIGYKGGIPIFDQTGDTMRNYTMLYPRSDGGTFYDFACTIFAMTSLQHATGNPTLPEFHYNVDLDNNGYIDPVELWGQGRKYANNDHSLATYDPGDTSTVPTGTSIGTVLLGNIISNVGYEVSYARQGTTAGNADIVERLKDGIPTTIRLKSPDPRNREPRIVDGLVPKKEPSEIDYFEFDMYDFNNYEAGSAALTNSGHTVLGVDARDFNGTTYISIVNSSSHHSSRVDTNLMWFEADDLLRDNFTLGYSIVGSTDPNWRPNTRYDIDQSTVGSFLGVTYGDALDSINSINYEYLNNQEIALSPTEGGTITIDGRFETKVVDDNTLHLYLGEVSGVKTILEFTNIENPRNNNIGDIGNNETTELFDLRVGNRSIVSTGTVDEYEVVIYNSFYDEVE